MNGEMVMLPLRKRSLRLRELPPQVFFVSRGGRAFLVRREGELLRVVARLPPYARRYP